MLWKHKKYYFKTLIALLNKAIKDVLQVLNGVSYVYFTSNKSSLIELMNWIDVNKTIGNPFKKAVRKETSNRIAHNAEYKDIMLYKTAA